MLVLKPLTFDIKLTVLVPNPSTFGAPQLHAATEDDLARVSAAVPKVDDAGTEIVDFWYQVDGAGTEPVNFWHFSPRSYTQLRKRIWRTFQLQSQKLTLPVMKPYTSDIKLTMLVLKPSTFDIKLMVLVLNPSTFGSYTRLRRRIWRVSAAFPKVDDTGSETVNFRCQVDDTGTKPVNFRY